MTTTEWWLLAAAGFAFGRWMDCLLRLRRREGRTVGCRSAGCRLNKTCIFLNKKRLLSLAKIDKDLDPTKKIEKKYKSSHPIWSTGGMRIGPAVAADAG